MSHPVSAELRAQIGQLVMAGFDGFMPDAAIESLIREQRIGGVILFRRNIDTPAQVAALCRRLQEINAQVSDVPLLIGIDQEGGMVMRIEEGVTPLPSAMAYASAYASHAVAGCSPADCEALHRVGADELRQLGVNINFAPSLDINNNRANPVIGVRSFGENSATVTVYGLAAQRGIQAAGIAATAKHFPGHGDTATDSHYALPLVPHEKSRLDAVELAPFKAAIAAGVDAIMTAHVVFPAIEPDTATPATLSRKVLTGLLREEMGFEGVIITDCLEMDAIADVSKGGVGTAQGAVAAIAAGADIALVSHTLVRQQEAVQLLIAAVEQGYISEDQVVKSIERITLLKQRRAMQNWRDLPMQAAALRTPAALALAAKVQQQAVLFSGASINRALPTVLVTVELLVRTEIDEVALGASVSERGTFLPFLQEAGMAVNELIISPQVSEAEFAQVIAATAQAEQIIFQSYNATRFARQMQLIATFDPAKLVLIAGRNPYDLDLVPQAKTKIAACSNRPAAQKAMAGFLLP
ncbi:beta-N-acetylhexosaminidase [Chitinibacter bivalviorum]|uniref:Beta-N-acetylhexosaminidase n=1 Tax=Chitinibacter bivalviorum TaxID=2739434 RepID=A0A7H9BJ47_9NEIS|nr:beta-N-acetylhexosaminidase [Chitinibacter bivalviorum]QLG88499.1 beta-N-acetylhexosaminidase [Chitinibacter bivalviorum]